jgi:predicted dienelactone hydrolase
MLGAVSRVLVLVALLVGSAAAALTDPSAMGPFPVGVTTLTLVDASRGRTLVTEVWYPAGAAGRDAPLRRGRYPLVLVAHGHCGFRTNYEYVTLALASRGFLVAAPDFPGFNKPECDAHGASGDLFSEPPRDLSFLRTVFRDRSGPAGAFARMARGRRAGLVGHSLGGSAVVNASIADPDFTAVVGLAPFIAGAAGAAQKLSEVRPRRAVLVVAGTADATIPPGSIEAFFEGLVPPAFFVKILGGTHSGFTDMDSHLTPEQLARQEDLTRRYATAFLERYLARDRRFRRFLTAADAAAQGTDVELTGQPR